MSSFEPFHVSLPADGCAALQAGANNSASEPVKFDGHYYRSSSATRSAGKPLRRSSATHVQGVQGHLARRSARPQKRTCSSTGCRNRFRMPGVFGHNGGGLWVGGFFQVPCATANPEPACGWMSLNGDPIARRDSSSTVGPTGEWRAERQSEADAGSTHHATEDFLAIGLKGRFGWNERVRCRTCGAPSSSTAKAIWRARGELRVRQRRLQPRPAQILTLPATAKSVPG